MVRTALLAVLLLACSAATALADIGRSAAIAVVARAPAARAIALAHPLARFGAARSQTAWTITLREPSATRPLGSWTVDARSGRLLGGGALPAQPPAPRVSANEAEAIARRNPEIAGWVHRYGRATATVDGPDAQGRYTVHLDARGQEIAQAVVDDASGRVVEAWTGPQVAWKMARGYDGAFGRKINDPRIWLALCAVFLLGLVEWRRPLSLRTLDLLALLSFSVSLAYFNQGDIFWSVPLAYPPMVYLLARLVIIGVRGSRRPSRPGSLPIWVLAGAAVFLIGFRGGLNAYNSNVIDVGYAGVIGADRLVRGQIPYGNMPTSTGTPCGPKYSDGSYSAFRQAGDGQRCESPNERGDTYGPIAYAAYVPALLAVGWTGRWDDLPAAHVTAVVFDALCALGLLVAGRRLGGFRLGAALAFAWAAYPFTAYALESNSNDMIVAALLVWGFVVLTSPLARGFVLALSAWTKFAPLLLFPLWARYPRAAALAPSPEWSYEEGAPLVPAPLLREQLPLRLRLRRAGPALAARLAGDLGPARPTALYALGLVCGTGLSALLLVGGGLDAFQRFWSSTFGWQLSRPSPFSIWDWGVYPGFPDLSLLQTALKALLVAGAALLFFVPRRLDAVRLAALTGALLIGFQLVLTHWFYLYIPWFFPFAALAFCAPSRRL